MFTVHPLMGVGLRSILQSMGYQPSISSFPEAESEISLPASEFVVVTYSSFRRPIEQVVAFLVALLERKQKHE